MMKIYKLERTEAGLSRGIYDCANGFVVVAEHPEQARELASQQHGDEGAEVWFVEHLSACVHLGTALKGAEAGVIIRNYHAG